MTDTKTAEVIDLRNIRPGRKPDTYYGRPAVRPSIYGWRIGTAFFAIGLGTGCQILSVLLDMQGREENRPIIRSARYLGLAGVLMGPILYVMDLHTPQRWFNMLRIFRKTSLMSIGSWSLTLLGGLSSLTAFGQLLEDSGHGSFGRKLARIAGIPAALLAVIASLYKGTEIEETSNPLWASAFPLLPALFASSDAKSAASALSLLNSSAKTKDTQKGLDAISLVSGLLELLFALSAVGKVKGHLRAADPFQKGSLSPPYGPLLGISLLAPLALKFFQTSERADTSLSRIASIANVAGGFILPITLIFAGNRSGREPKEYLSYARSQNGERNPGREKSKGVIGANTAAGLALAGAAALFYGITRVKEKQ